MSSRLTDGPSEARDTKGEERESLKDRRGDHIDAVKYKSGIASRDGGRGGPGGGLQNG